MNTYHWLLPIAALQFALSGGSFQIFKSLRVTFPFLSVSSPRFYCLHLECSSPLSLCLLADTPISSPASASSASTFVSCLIVNFWFSSVSVRPLKFPNKNLYSQNKTKRFATQPWAFSQWCVVSIYTARGGFAVYWTIDFHSYPGFSTAYAGLQLSGVTQTIIGKQMESIRNENEGGRVHDWVQTLWLVHVAALIILLQLCKMAEGWSLSMCDPGCHSLISVFVPLSSLSELLWH